MKKIIKQVAGIDVAQKELVVTIGRTYEDLCLELFAHRIFENSTKGFASLLKWVDKLCSDPSQVHYVMEATGVYHESFSYFLVDQKRILSIVLPNKISNYMRTLDVKTITDKSCSEAITRFGLERKLDLWQKPHPIYKKLRQLTRERDQLVVERTAAKNQLHAECVEAEPNASTLRRIKQRIAVIIKQIKEIETELRQVINSDSRIKHFVKIISSIKGIGDLTAATILAETNGFELIRNKRQLISYAGLDVKEKLSGTSVRGKAKISKRGNRYLRKAMYMPALSAIKYDERFKMVYHRLVSRNGIKMKACVAVQRRLLELAYTLFKTNQLYDKDYHKQIMEQTLAA